MHYSLNSLKSSFAGSTLAAARRNHRFVLSAGEDRSRTIPLPASLILVPVVLQLLTGCASKGESPRPTSAPDRGTHEYVVVVKNQGGVPISGVPMYGVAVDLATYLLDDRPNRPSWTSQSNANGLVEVTVAPRLAQHFKGRYYTPINEPEIARQVFPDGRNDIWGYFTEFRVTGPNGTKIFSNFELPSKHTRRYEIPLIIQTPELFGNRATHIYRFKANDKFGNPVAGASVSARVTDFAMTTSIDKNNAPSTSALECTTDDHGKCAVSLSTNMSLYLPDVITRAGANEGSMSPAGETRAYFGFLTSATAHGGLGDFFRSREVRATVTGSASSSDQSPELALTVPTPQDFFCPALKQAGVSGPGQELARWVRTISLAGDLRRATLEGLCVEEFKGRRYMSIELRYRRDFNEQRLSNYAIGVVLFDEVVRKLLEPLDRAGANLSVDGYKVSVTTVKSDFTDRAKSGETLSYSFYHLRDFVRRYRQADISGQKLINESIVLVDGERIDLELK